MTAMLRHRLARRRFRAAQAASGTASAAFSTREPDAAAADLLVERVPDSRDAPTISSAVGSITTSGAARAAAPHRQHTRGTALARAAPRRRAPSTASPGRASSRARPRPAAPRRAARRAGVRCALSMPKRSHSASRLLRLPGNISRASASVSVSFAVDRRRRRHVRRARTPRRGTPRRTARCG